MATKFFCLVCTLAVLTGAIFQNCEAKSKPTANIEVSVGTSGVKINKSDNPSINVTGTPLTSIEIAVYVISCLAVFFITICCFYCCKHFCCDGCRGEATVTYQQMGPTPFNTGSVRLPVAVPVTATTPVRRSTISNQNETEANMIPLQGMKRVTFASTLKSTAATDLLPPPYVYENYP